MYIGIDEVGRGAFAGPVTVCVFASSLTAKNLLTLFPNKILKDSKALTKKEREAIYKKLLLTKKEGCASWVTSHKSAAHIDTKGLTWAIASLVEKGLSSLAAKNCITPTQDMIFLDGGLSAPKNYKNQKTIIKGDTTNVYIACASIIAKVTRDTLMKNMAKKYPDYDFENNVGYGTKAHQIAIQTRGISEVHRLLFLRKMLKRVDK